MIGLRKPFALIAATLALLLVACQPEAKRICWPFKLWLNRASQVPWWGVPMVTMW